MTEHPDMAAIMLFADEISNADQIDVASGDREPSATVTKKGREWIVAGLRLLARYNPITIATAIVPDVTALRTELAARDAEIAQLSDQLVIVRQMAFSSSDYTSDLEKDVDGLRAELAAANARAEAMARGLRKAANTLEEAAGDFMDAKEAAERRERSMAANANKKRAEICTEAAREARAAAMAAIGDVG